MSKNVSAKYYQEKKETLQKKLVKDIKFFLKNKNEKSNNMVVNYTKIYQKIKSKCSLSIEKKNYKIRKKCLIIIIRNHYFKK